MRRGRTASRLNRASASAPLFEKAVDGITPGKKATIIAAAGELFLEKGFDAFSMRQVAARIGYSATTIYHHFLNKEDLLRAVLDSAFATFEKEMRSADLSGPLRGFARNRPL